MGKTPSNPKAGAAAAGAAAEEDRWSRLQRTVHERLDPSADYVDTVARVVDHVWTEEQRREATAALKRYRDEGDTSSPLCRILINDYNMQEHYGTTKSHREFIVKSYRRLEPYVDAVDLATAEAHDLSKYSLAEAVGYTQRWVHKQDGDSWQQALGHHYSAHPHHPQWFTIARTGDGRMTRAALQESLVDMVACRWERELKGREDAADSELVDIAPGFLERYEREDRELVRRLMEDIATGRK